MKRKPYIYPLTDMEIQDRMWDARDLQALCASGRLMAVKPQYFSQGMTVYFETWKDRVRYRGLRTRRDQEYEREERILADMCGAVYPGDSIDKVKNPNPVFWEMDKPQRRQAAVKAEGLQDGWESFCGVVKCVWFILELLMLPFAILGMRDGAQWFFGTGEYGKGRGDDWV